MEHKNVNIKTCVFSAPDSHSVYIHTYVLSYTCIGIQPADKPVKHLINSYKLVLLILKKKQKKATFTL